MATAAADWWNWVIFGDYLRSFWEFDDVNVKILLLSGVRRSFELTIESLMDVGGERVCNRSASSAMCDVSDGLTDWTTD